jgi:Flp pilus assembly protein TadB
MTPSATGAGLDALPWAPDRAAAVAALLCVALLVSSARIGPARLRALGDPPPAPAAQRAPVRLPWIVVGAIAVGALAWAVAGAGTGIAAGGLAGAAGAVAARIVAGRAGAERVDGSDLAAGWELVAVGLEAGLPVAVAVSAAAEPLGGNAGALLRRVGGLLELGADAANAWRTVEHDAALGAFARAAGRSASTGAALAEVARSEAERLRSALVDSAQERAQRAAVLITGPLGLCFLPAFLALGIAPVVVGLAGEALAQW